MKWVRYPRTEFCAAAQQWEGGMRIRRDADSARRGQGGGEHRERVISGMSHESQGGKDAARPAQKRGLHGKRRTCLTHTHAHTQAGKLRGGCAPRGDGTEGTPPQPALSNRETGWEGNHTTLIRLPPPPPGHHRVVLFLIVVVVLLLWRYPAAIAGSYMNI